ncbi:MAG TPA: VWA domain-containing protein, partial [Myxococcota bacterium]|nr:VWA domain-containing protein [Myxococcota bacterium]
LIASCERHSSAATPGENPLVDGPEKAPTDLAAIPETVEVKMPSDRVITRECFGRMPEEERVSASPKASYRSASNSGSSAPATPVVAAAPPPPSPAPSGLSGMGVSGGGQGGGGTADGIGGLGTRGRGAGDGYGAGPATSGTESAARSEPARTKTTEAAKPAADAPAQAAEAQEAPAEPTARRESSEKKKDANEDLSNGLRGDKGEAGPLAGATTTPDATSMANIRDEESRWDWGATTYLSNDDSMSLASAQRMLWAIQNRGGVSASQIRPHEFLNYFSFDTRPVAKGETFSVMASAEKTGPDSLTLAMAVKGATPARMPLDLTLVLDRSGSMSAEGRMSYLKRGLNKMVAENLKKGDRVDFVLFDHELCTPLENFVVGRDDPALLTDIINALQPRGSTNLDIGLKEGYRIATNHVDTSGRNRRMMLITDALINTGDVNPDTVSQISKAYEESGIRLTGVGVGKEFNDKVLDTLTEKGKGAYVYLGSEAVVDRIFGVGFESMVRTIAHNVRFALDLPPSLAMERFYGEESSTNPEDIQPIHYYSGTSQLFLQDLHFRPTGLASSDPVKFTVTWDDPQTGAKKTQEFQANVGDLLASDPRNIHKAQALMAWTDLLSTRAMGGSPCGEPFSIWKTRVGALGGDAEIDWLDGLTRPLCGETAPPPTPRVAGVPYKVKLDSDMPIAEVSLSCNGSRWSESMKAGDTVAMFSSATPGASCLLTLQGTVPMTANVQVPVTGGDLRCMVRGGRLSCS